jgi:DNA invertase Pin-like site-specific DNA recombinase
MPELSKLLSHLRTRDTVVVYKLDRLGRSLQHLLELVLEFEKQGVFLNSISDSIDTSTPNGRLVFNIFGSLAQFERELIKERTMAGLAAARARGRNGGRPKGISDESEKTAIVPEILYKERKLPVNDIAKRLNISKATFYKYLRHRGVSIGLAN